MELENKTKKNTGIFIGVLVVLGVLFVTIFLGKKPADIPIENIPINTPINPVIPPVNPVLPPANTVVPPIDKPKQPVLIYKDGTYSATGSYMSPGGPDQVLVNLTLKNDVITNITVTPEPGDNTSSRYQNEFASNYKQYVLGKNIADVYLTKVSGSSLTSKGFNSALAQIKSQAKA